MKKKRSMNGAGLFSRLDRASKKQKLALARAKERGRAEGMAMVAQPAVVGAGFGSFLKKAGKAAQKVGKTTVNVGRQGLNVANQAVAKLDQTPLGAFIPPKVRAGLLAANVANEQAKQLGIGRFGTKLQVVRKPAPPGKRLLVRQPIIAMGRRGISAVSKINY